MNNIASTTALFAPDWKRQVTGRLDRRVVPSLSRADGLEGKGGTGKCACTHAQNRCVHGDGSGACTHVQTGRYHPHTCANGLLGPAGLRISRDISKGMVSIFISSPLSHQVM